MAVWFEKLVRQGVLMFSERKITFLHRPGYLHQEIANHRGTNVKHLGKFTCFHITLPLDALCVGFYILEMSLQHLQLQPQPPKSHHTMVAELLEKMLSIGQYRSKAFIITPIISTWQLYQG